MRMNTLASRCDNAAWVSRARLPVHGKSCSRRLPGHRKPSTAPFAFLPNETVAAQRGPGLRQGPLPDLVREERASLQNSLHQGKGLSGDGPLTSQIASLIYQVYLSYQARE